jgi:hypothetical protein
MGSLLKDRHMAKSELDEEAILNTLTNYRAESRDARQERLASNKINFDTYHLRQDWSDKQKGQSREFLPKMAMATEQNAIFLQQGLIDMGDWFKAEAEEGLNEDALRIRPGEIQRMLLRQLNKDGFNTKVNDAAKLGLIGSLIIAKVHGKWVQKPKYEARVTLKDGKFVRQLVKKEDKVWQLVVELVRQEDYYPDPTGGGLYELQDIYMDYWQIEQLATGKDAIYDLAKVKQLAGDTGDSDGLRSEYNKAREAGQLSSNNRYRRRHKLTEIWGNIIDRQGRLVHENVVCTVVDDRYVIQKPTPNPLWHKESPFVAAPIFTVPHGVWGKAPMDAPALLNKAINEMFNLTIDGGMMSVHGIKQIRTAYLEEPEQVENGIFPGITLKVNSACPPNVQVLERVDTSTIPQDGLAVLNLLNQEHNSAAMTNDMRMGITPFKQVKATEIVENSQTNNTMFSGIAKNLETLFLTRLLEKAWKTIAQHMSDLNSDEMKSLIGPQRWAQIANLSNEELFAETVGKVCFRVFGISATLNKQRDFSKLQGLLQTIGTSPVLMEEYNKKYSFVSLLTQIIQSLGIDPYKLEAPETEGGDLTQGQNQGPAMGGQGGPAATMPGQPQTQIPQAGAQNSQGDSTPESNIPTEHFPQSRATPKGGMVPQGATS